MSSVYDHPDYQHLLAAVRAAPDDDLPRLVLADWLEERGEAESRVELIRVQCDPLYTLPCEQVEYPLDGVEGLESYSDIEVRCLCYHDGRTPPQEQWCPQCRARHRAMQIIEAGDDENTRHVPHPFTGDGWTGYVVKTYDRGFVHTVRGPLVSLIGGDCEPCGRGWLTRHADGRPHDCPACHGTGRTPGVLRELVRREPVTTVTLSDIHPDPTSGDMWIWSEEAFEQWPEIAEHFGQFAYDSQDSALKAMSDWLLRTVTEANHGEAARIFDQHYSVRVVEVILD